MHERIARLRNRLAELKVDAILVSHLPNIRYLFGFTGSNAIGLIGQRLCHFITDRRYIQQSVEQVTNAEITIARKDLYAELEKLLRGSGLGVVAVEAQYLSVQNYFNTKKRLPGIKLVASERVIERIASVKTECELEDIREAARICCQVYERVVEQVKVGVSELDISAELSYRSKREGSEKDPFEPIVASGLRSALPHGISSHKKIVSGELVVMDFGATVNGYAADFTRTLVVGAPNEKQASMAAVVKGAIEQAECQARAGLTGKQLDAVARDYISEQGYGEYFQHSLGHGLGLNVHELPRVGDLSNDPLEIGNVITLEPGVYLPDIGGVRIEDDFVLTKSGAENLTPVSRGLLSVG